MWGDIRPPGGPQHLAGEGWEKGKGRVVGFSPTRWMEVVFGPGEGEGVVKGRQEEGAGVGKIRQRGKEGN